jgi:2-polyprenyl-3-methyl-5-hydroxy-6-metoxy-1,4-benzoquinol methylase
LVKCKQCQLVYLEQLPEFNIKKHYNNPQYFEGYLAQRENFKKIFQKILKNIEKYHKKGRLLEIGFGSGLLLELAQKKGWEVWGVEISSWAVKQAKENFRNRIFEGEIENLDLPENYFEVIVINHVLEHSLAPDKILNKSFRLLKRGGVLFIGLPNFASFFSKILRKKWPGLGLPDHIWQFDLKTIQALVRKQGFQIIKAKSETGFSLYAPPLKRLKEIILFFLDKIGLGDALMILAKK